MRLYLRTETDPHSYRFILGDVDKNVVLEDKIFLGGNGRKEVAVYLGLAKALFHIKKVGFGTVMLIRNEAVEMLKNDTMPTGAPGGDQERINTTAAWLKDNKDILPFVEFQQFDL